MEEFHPERGRDRLWPWEVEDPDGQPPGFPTALFTHLLGEGPVGLDRLLHLDARYDGDVQRFLADKPRLLWLHQLRMGATAAVSEGGAPASLFYSRAAATLYGEAKVEEASIGTRALFLHLGKLSHLAAGPGPQGGAEPDAEPGAVSVSTRLQPGATSAAPLRAQAAFTSWPLQRANDEIYAVMVQRGKEGLPPTAEVPVARAADMIRDLIANPPAGDDPVEPFLLALDLWNVSRWDLDDAEARDRADSLVVGNAGGDETHAGAVRAERQLLLHQIWYSIWARGGPWVRGAS